MHDWGVFPNNKRCSMQKKLFVKLIYSTTPTDHQIFLQIFSQVLRNNIKYVISRAVSRAVLGAVQSAFSDDSWK